MSIWMVLKLKEEGSHDFEDVERLGAHLKFNRVFRDLNIVLAWD